MNCIKDTSNVYYCISFKAESDGNRFDENNEIFWSYFARAPEKNKLTIVTDNEKVLNVRKPQTNFNLKNDTLPFKLDFDIITYINICK